MNRTIQILSYLLGPLLFIALLIVSHLFPEHAQLYKVLGLALWMVSWWITEAVPIPISAILPIILLAPLGISSIAEASAPYASPIIFLFMGGFLIALGLEKHNLHLRISLNLIRLTGSSGNGIILGFMLATALLSMWISNTATAVMMLPIATSITSLLLDKDADQLSKNEKQFALGLMLSIAYAANVGGTITLIGTPPNVVMAGYLSQILNYEMGFSNWLMIGAPVGLILLVIIYFLITKLLFPNNIKAVTGSKELVRTELKKLGPISREEKLVLAVFSITAIGWVFKSQINWLAGFDLLSDAMTAMIGGALMFAIPRNLSDFHPLMEWKDTEKLPWGILLLFGGGMSLAKAMEKVGIIQVMGDFVSGLGELNPLAIVLISTTLVLFLTELMSNVALVTIFIPVIIGVANGLDVDPLLLVIPTTIASSCAFMMPISTPPNAIVFSSGRIKMSEMMRAGVILNIIAILVLVFLTEIIVPGFFL